MKIADSWQGKFDALCGIYSASHILAAHHFYGNGEKRTEAIYDEVAGRAFVHLMRCVESAGLLTAKKIVLQSGSGFYDHELVDIFERLPSREKRGLQAIAFTSTWFKALKNSERRALIDQQMAYAIVREHGKRHWIAILGRKANGEYIIFDPSRQDAVSSRKALRYSRGVLIAAADVIGTQ